MNPQLPPLPEPELASQIVDSTMRYTTVYSYQASEMTAYGLQCAEAERARCRKIALDAEIREISRRQHYASSVAEMIARQIGK